MFLTPSRRTTRLISAYVLWQHLPSGARFLVRHGPPFLLLIIPWILFYISNTSVDVENNATLGGMLIAFLCLLLFGVIFEWVFFVRLYGGEAAHWYSCWYATSEKRKGLLQSHKESGLIATKLLREIERDVQPLPYWETCFLMRVWDKDLQDAWRITSCAKALTLSLRESVCPTNTSQSTVKPRRRL